jgi:hypothetical protein
MISQSIGALKPLIDTVNIRPSWRVAINIFVTHICNTTSVAPGKLPLCHQPYESFLISCVDPRRIFVEGA